MAQPIRIPDLNGAINVTLNVSYGGIKHAFPNDTFPFDEKLKLPRAKRVLDLGVAAVLEFPPRRKLDNTVEGTPDGMYGYMQTITAVFPLIRQDDHILILSDTNQKPLQTVAVTSEKAYYGNPFKFIEGWASLSATPNPRLLALSVRMALGSPDKVTVTWKRDEREGSWKSQKRIQIGGGDDSKDKNGGPNQAGIVDRVIQVYEGVKDTYDRAKDAFEMVKDMIPRVEWSHESQGGGSTSTSGGSREVGKLVQTPHWTLMLELPEPPKPPQVYDEGGEMAVWFATGKKEIGNYRAPRYPHIDQVKELMRFMDEQLRKYGGKENISKIRIVGHASKLGDTTKNLNLGLDRANHVANLLKMTYPVKFTEDTIKTRGEPLTEGNDREDSWKDRVVWISVDAKRIVQ